MSDSDTNNTPTKKQIEALTRIYKGDFSAASSDIPDNSDIVIVSDTGKQKSISDTTTLDSNNEKTSSASKELLSIKKDSTQLKSTSNNVLPLASLQNLENIVSNAIHKELSNYNISPKQDYKSFYEAELGINVLKYKFNYSEVYSSEQMLIFVLADNSFSLTLDQPVEFSLSYEGIDIPSIICIGKPLLLSALNTSLLIFVKK